MEKIYLLYLSTGSKNYELLHPFKSTEAVQAHIDSLVEEWLKDDKVKIEIMSDELYITSRTKRNSVRTIVSKTKDIESDFEYTESFHYYTEEWEVKD